MEKKRLIEQKELVEQWEKELQEYKNSKEFEQDCTMLKNWYATFEEEMPTDLEIEEQAIHEKRIYFEAIQTCSLQGHDWEEVIETFGGNQYPIRYCNRCGKVIDGYESPQ